MQSPATTEQDEYWMRQALELAEKAASRDEVPVGAILVQDGKILSSGYNLRETLHSPLGHAEMLSLQRASKKLGAWRLMNTTLYVTLEPCLMCAGAMIQARVPRLVYGTRDPKGGAVHSLYQVCQDTRLNHQLEITEGVLADECSQILKDFFKKRESKSRTKYALQLSNLLAPLPCQKH